MGLKMDRVDLTHEYKLEETTGPRASGASSSSAGGAAGPSGGPTDFRARGAGQASLNQTGWITEVMPDYSKWDASGLVWGRHGHYPLFVFLGYGRHHSEEGERERQVAKGKKKTWKSGGMVSWPYWTQHESEKAYWLPGGPSTGRGYSGSHGKDHICKALAQHNQSRKNPTLKPIGIA